MTVALVLLGVVCVVLLVLWRRAEADARRYAAAARAANQRSREQEAELDALSITPPRIDTRTGSHDALPIRDDIRATLTAYCEGMWQHTQEKP